MNLRNVIFAKAGDSMRNRLRVAGNMAVLRLISGGTNDASSGLILHGADQCFELANALIEAGDKIVENENNLSFSDLRARKNYRP